MKAVISLFLISFVLVTFVGVSFAKQMSGEVTNVNVEKGTMSIKGVKMEVQFDCETPIIKDVKVGEHVTVKYSEKDGKKVVTEVKQMKKKMKKGGEK